MGAFILLLVGAAESVVCGDSKVGIAALAAQGAAIGVVECDPATEQQQALQREQERQRAEATARTLASSLRAEFDALQAATEAARIKHRQALDQERERADALAREIAALAQRDTAETTGREAAQAIEAGIKQTEALEQERDKAYRLARELDFVREALEAARIVVSKAVQSAETDVQRDRALAIERDKAGNLACIVATLRVELEKAQVAASEAAKVTPPPAEHAQALDRERARADALSRDLSSARADAAKAVATEEEQRQKLEKELQQQRDGAKALERELVLLRADLDRAREAAQEPARNVEAASRERKQELEKERTRSDALAHELASTRKEVDERSARLAATYAEVLQVRDQLDVANRQLAKASRPLTFVNGLPEWVATSLSAVNERPPRYVPDEQKLLALATILLRRTDISEARPLLEHAAQSGSARAAFMLAETYDKRMLPSWRARRIWGNASKALELYERAQSGGIKDASERIKRLQKATFRSSRAQVR